MRDDKSRAPAYLSDACARTWKERCPHKQYPVTGVFYQFYQCRRPLGHGGSHVAYTGLQGRVSWAAYRVDAEGRCHKHVDD